MLATLHFNQIPLRLDDDDDDEEEDTVSTVECECVCLYGSLSMSLTIHLFFVAVVAWCVLFLPVSVQGAIHCFMCRNAEGGQ